MLEEYLFAMAFAKSETSDLSSEGGRETASVVGSAALKKSIWGSTNRKFNYNINFATCDVITNTQALDLVTHQQT